MWPAGWTLEEVSQVSTREAPPLPQMGAERPGRIVCQALKLHRGSLLSWLSRAWSSAETLRGRCGSLSLAQNRQHGVLQPPGRGPNAWMSGEETLKGALAPHQSNWGLPRATFSSPFKQSETICQKASTHFTVFLLQASEVKELSDICLSGL